MKRPKAKPSENRVEFARRVLAAGAEYRMVTGIDEVIALGL
jgi:hypothetical protein